MISDLKYSPGWPQVGCLRPFLGFARNSPPLRRAISQDASSGKSDTVVIVDPARPGLVFPTPVVVSAVFRRTLEVLLGDAGPVATEAGIVLERLPRHRIMIVSDTQKTAKAQNRVRDLAGSLIDHDTLNRTDLRFFRSINRGALDLVTTDQTVSLPSVAMRSSFENLQA
jgi:hypothetical protein